MNSGYEWDETRRQANLAKHGLDFETVRRFGWDTALPGSARDNDMADGYLENGLTPEELAAVPPYGKVAHLTFVEIEALYDEETAISAGIATDPDTWELTDEDFAQMRPVAEVFPELAAAHRPGKVKLPPNPPGAQTIPRTRSQSMYEANVIGAFHHYDEVPG